MKGKILIGINYPSRYTIFGQTNKMRKIDEYEINPEIKKCERVIEDLLNKNLKINYNFDYENWNKNYFCKLVEISKERKNIME